jgi:hypothetical protein
MSHDDPTGKDATKKAPDRGGRSFLRTDSFPSLARMGARWTAFSLAARGGLCVSSVVRSGSSTARLFLRVVGMSVTCALVSACWYFQRDGMAVKLFSDFNLCPRNQIVVKPLPPPEPPAGFAGSLSMWHKKYDGWSWYQLEGCGATTVFRCGALGSCRVGMW